MASDLILPYGNGLLSHHNSDFDISKQYRIRNCPANGPFDEGKLKCL